MSFRSLPIAEQRRIRRERREYRRRQERTPEVRNTKKLRKLLDERGAVDVLPLMKGREQTGRLLLRREKIRPVEERLLPVWLQRHAPLTRRLSEFVREFLFWDRRSNELVIRQDIPREELPDKLYWNFTNVIGKELHIPPYESREKLTKEQVLFFLHNGEIPDKVLPSGEPVFMRWTDAKCKYYNRVERGRKFANSLLSVIEEEKNIPFWIKAFVSDWTYSGHERRNSIRLSYVLGDRTVKQTMNREFRFPSSERCDLSSCDPSEILRAYHRLCKKREEVITYLAKTGLFEKAGIRANYLTQSGLVDWKAGTLTTDLLRKWASLCRDEEARDLLVRKLHRGTAK